MPWHRGLLATRVGVACLALVLWAGARRPAAAAAPPAPPAKAPAAKAPAKPPAKAPAVKAPATVTVTDAAAALRVAGTPWARLARVLPTGDVDATRAALTAATKAGLPPKGPARWAARHLVAEVDLALGGKANGARALAALAKTADPVAAPWVAAEAISAGLDAGLEPQGLEPLLQRIPEGHPAAPKVRLALAQALWAAPKPAKPGARARGALACLGQVAAYPLAQKPDAEALRATLLEARGHRARARRLWLDLYLHHPAAPAAAPAAGRLAALAGPHDHPPTLHQQVRRLERLLAAHRNQAVIDGATPLLPRIRAGTRLGCRLRFALGKASRMARNYRDAIDVLSQVARRCHHDRALEVKTLYLWASAASILLKDPAIPIYRRLVRRFPHHPYADDALFFIADLHLRAHRLEKARKVLVEEVRTYPHGDYAEEARWRLFWLDWEAGHPDKGLPWLDAVVAQGHGRVDDFDVARALYWKARTLARDPKQRPAAADLYARVVNGAPLSYQAALALGRLQALDPARAKAVKAALPPRPSDPPGFAIAVRPAFAHARVLRRGLHLLRLGLDDAAAEVLGQAKALARGPDEVRLLARLLDRAGDARDAQLLVRLRIPDFDRHYPRGDGWGLWRAAYPLAFRPQIDRWARHFGIPPDLEQAIIREESALDPKVVSWAGAVGLAQLMPATARDLARQIGLEGHIDVQSLQRPAVNLRLSAHYLARLLKTTGNVALTIAAYNAGVRTVMHWARRWAGLDLDAFVEHISIAETRRYTRRVLRTYFTYRYLYGKPGHRFLALPAKVGPRSGRR